MSDYILAIDPGNRETGFCFLDSLTYKPLQFGKIDNELFIKKLSHLNYTCNDKFIIEMVASYGMPVGKDVFETCVFIGRIIEHIPNYEFIYRKEEKMCLCGTMTHANDTSIRHALIERFATHDYRTGKGTKKNPDWFYGFAADVWAAYAVGVTYLDKQKMKKE